MDIIDYLYDSDYEDTHLSDNENILYIIYI